MTKNEIYKKLESELDWYRAYGMYINLYYNKVDSEACEYADNENKI
tara:strand:- start:985 stop:1122 length:138 start_codon:yes stop_codon:yes gene_type:complete